MDDDKDLNRSNIQSHQGEIMRSVLLCLSLAVTPTIAKAQPSIFWQDEGEKRIKCADLDGSNVRDLVKTHGGTGLAVDSVRNKIYWSTNVDRPLIQRANLDGSKIETVVSSGLSTPEGLAVDVRHRKLYWTDQGPNKVSRSNLDGTAVKVLITSETQHPHDIDLDLVTGKMYWTDSSQNKIYVANLDGKNIEVVLNMDGNPSPRGFAIDANSGHMYFARQGAGKIQRAKLDGSDVEDVYTKSGWNGPDGIALDLTHKKLYWTGLNENLKIQRANLDGSNVEVLVTKDLKIPRHIDLCVLKARAAKKAN
jgi:DNA-binding beta-propeller fold protein YncE